MSLWLWTVAIGAVVLVGHLLTYSGPVRKRRGKGLRPVPKLTTADPLAPLFGGTIAFPPDPDEQGGDQEHHLSIDPSELGSPGGPSEGAP